MIGKITGRIDYRASDHVLIDTGALGYMVFASERSLAALPADGEMVSLYTIHLVREDLQQLFGFTTIAEREWHRLLTSVQGIGAKVALAILGTLGVDGVARAITLGDANAIKAAHGVGVKTAQRVVLELKDKSPAIMAMGAAAKKRAQGLKDTVIDAKNAEDVVIELEIPEEEIWDDASLQADALSALVNLGYGHGDAAEAVMRVLSEEPSLETAGLIRAALKKLAPKD